MPVVPQVYEHVRQSVIAALYYIETGFNQLSLSFPVQAIGQDFPGELYSRFGSQHRLEQGFPKGGTHAGYFACGHHLDSQFRVNAEQPGPAEHGKLYRVCFYMVADQSPRQGLPEHAPRCQLDEIHVDGLAGVRHGARCPEIAFYHVYPVPLDYVLYVERALYAQLSGYFPGIIDYPFLYLIIKRKRWYDHAGVPAVHASRFYVLNNSTYKGVPAVAHAVHFNLLCIFYELGNHDGIVPAEPDSLAQVTFEIKLVPRHFHGRAREHIGGPDDYGVSYFSDKIIDTLHSGEAIPLGLRYPKPVKQR